MNWLEKTFADLTKREEAVKKAQALFEEGLIGKLVLSD